MSSIINKMAGFYDNDEQTATEVMAMARLLFDYYALHLETALATPPKLNLNGQRREAHEVL